MISIELVSFDILPAFCSIMFLLIICMIIDIFAVFQLLAPHLVYFFFSKVRRLFFRCNKRK